MTITDILGLVGGLALFLHGMQMMSAGLEAAAGNRMKEILEKLTANRVMGVLVGAGITAVIQSSSATTVMTVGFVNSGMMTLRQAVWIIMGANIGTTITSQLIALDVGALAPLFAFVGVAMALFLKNPKLHHYGNIIAGLGVLFIGMEMMSSSMMPLRDSEAFLSLMTSFSNPVLGILAGAAFTAVIQSSSASVGILQALAAGGLIGLPSAVFVLFGQNIGTCITAILASVGTSRNAKRTTVIHLMFNLIGTILFTLLCLLTPLTAFMEALTPGNPTAQIANVHTLFNIVTTLLLLPAGGGLVRLAEHILPDQPGQKEEGMHLAYLSPVTSTREYTIGSSAIYLNQLRRELERMLDMAQENVALAFRAVEQQDIRLLERLDEQEDYIDFLNKEISKFISHVIVREANEADSAAVSACFRAAGNIERIGDHASNIGGYTPMLLSKGIQFSPEASRELAEMREICLSALATLDEGDQGSYTAWLTKVSALEQRIDDMTDAFRDNHLSRMRAGLCSDEACILFSEILTDFERIGDHVLNIAQDRAALTLDTRG